MKEKRFLAAAAAIVMMLSLAGCGGKAEEETADTVQSTEQTTTAGESVSAEEPRYKMEYDENGEPYLYDNKTDEIIPSFPEGWSGERISKMVTIDGYQLTLPCKVSDILDLSEDFRLDESMAYDYGDGTSSYRILYKDVIAADGVFDNESNMIETINLGGNEYTKFEGTASTMPEEVFSLFNDFPKFDEDYIIVKYFQGNVIYGFHCSRYNTYSKVFLAWNNIQDVEVGTAI